MTTPCCGTHKMAGTTASVVDCVCRGLSSLLVSSICVVSVLFHCMPLVCIFVIANCGADDVRPQLTRSLQFLAHTCLAHCNF